MLVLTRRLGEGLIIGDNIKISKSQIKLEIEASRDVVIYWEEVAKKINESPS